jgi:hypothetical protein
VDVWGGMDVSGLFGSTTDSEGYGFALNTYTAAAALLPVARYNASYAAALGRYGVCVASAARLFLRNFTAADRQDNYDWSAAHDPGGGIGYEGVRHYGPSAPPYNRTGPWGTGDAMRGGRPSNLSPYGGSYVGLMAAMVVPPPAGAAGGAVPVFDLHATDWHHAATAWPTFLAFNPLPDAALTLRLPPCDVCGEGPVDVYDAVSQTLLARGLPRGASPALDLVSGQAAVAVVVPSSAPLTYDAAHGWLLAANGVIDYAAAGLPPPGPPLDD